MLQHFRVGFAKIWEPVGNSQARDIFYSDLRGKSIIGLEVNPVIGFSFAKQDAAINQPLHHVRKQGPVAVFAFQQRRRSALLLGDVAGHAQ